MPWVIPFKLKVDFSRVNTSPKNNSEKKQTKKKKKKKKEGRIRKKFRGFASDVLEKTASIFARHEQIAESEFFVLQKRKKENSNKPPYRILTRRKPICCIAYSHTEEQIFTLWHYCSEILPAKMPSSTNSKTINKWLRGHFTMLAIEESPSHPSSTDNPQDRDLLSPRQYNFLSNGGKVGGRGHNHGGAAGTANRGQTAASDMAMDSSIAERRKGVRGGDGKKRRRGGGGGVMSQQMRKSPRSGGDESFDHKDGSSDDLKSKLESPYAVVEGAAVAGGADQSEVPARSSRRRRSQLDYYPMTRNNNNNNNFKKTIPISGETTYALILSFSFLGILIIREVHAYLLLLGLALILAAMHSFLASDAVIRSILRLNIVTSKTKFRLLTKTGRLIPTTQQPPDNDNTVRGGRQRLVGGAASPLDGAYRYDRNDNPLSPHSFDHDGPHETPRPGVMMMGKDKGRLKGHGRTAGNMYNEKDEDEQLLPPSPPLPVPLIRTHSLSSFTSNPSRPSSPSSSSVVPAAAPYRQAPHSNSKAPSSYQHYNNDTAPDLVDVQIDVFPCREFVSSPANNRQHHHQQPDVGEGELGSSPPTTKSAALTCVVNFDIFVEGVSARSYCKRMDNHKDGNQIMTTAASAADSGGFVGEGSAIQTSSMRNMMEPILNKTVRRRNSRRNYSISGSIAEGDS
eukprot:jgi/Bigna1/75590/fgenesh1_pg.35_\